MSDSQRDNSRRGIGDINNRRPTPPGEVLRHEILEENGITQEKLADAMGVSRYTVNQLVNARRSVTAETALRLGRATSTSPKFWLNLQRMIDLYDAQQELAEVLERVKIIVQPVMDEDLIYDLPSSNMQDVEDNA